MVTKQGSKLLDFGLAKMDEPATAGSSLSMLPTTPANLTAAGTILGTFHYMAPEQIEGEQADARTDIFAFGVVLYEMVTGKKAFVGKTQASLFGAILKEEPPPISALQPLAPPNLDRIVRKCLAKDPDERWQSAKDLCDELRWVAEAGSQAATSTPAVAATRRTSRGLIAWASVATVTAVAAIVALGALYLRSAPATDAPPIRFTVAPPPNVTLRPGPPSLLAISPDGRRLAFVAARAGGNLLWVRSLDSLEAQPLAGTEDAVAPFWSPDSRTVAFFTGGGTTLKTIDATGGPVRTLSDALPIGRGGTWGLDGVIVIGSLTAGLFKLSANGGTPTPLTRPDSARGEAHRVPTFLPDGQHLLYLAAPSNTIWLGSLDGTAPTRLLAADSQVVYVPPGWLLFTRQGTLLAQPFDAGRNTLTGEAVPIAEQMALAGSGAPVVVGASFGASPTGVLVYRTRALAAPTQLTWVDRAGKSLGTVGQPGAYRNPELSPDGTRVVMEALDPQGRNRDIWVLELSRGVTSRFTSDPANDIYPVWSQDGAQIMFGSDRDGGVSHLFEKRSDAVGTEQPVLKSTADMTPYAWSADGDFVLYRARAGGGSTNLGVLPLGGKRPSTSSGRSDPAEGRTPHLFEPSRFIQAFGQLSPDGRWIAYGSDESGRFEVYVQSFPAPGGGKWQISKDGAAYSRWRRDGREIFYYAADGRIMAVPLKGTSALEVGAAVPLFEPRLLGGWNAGPGFRPQFDVAPDGQRFLLNVPAAEQAPESPITVVVNWAAGLRK